MNTLRCSINSTSIDESADISFDGLMLYFSSYSKLYGGYKGYGKYDIYVSRRDTMNSPWQTPVNLGSKVNSPIEEFNPSISSDERTLYFGVVEDVTVHGSATVIYQVSITPVLDFNRDGEVDSRDLDILNRHLGEEGEGVK